MPAFRPTRRSFVKTAAVASAGAVAAFPAASYARILGANEQIRVGVIGLGGMARHHLDNLMHEPDVQVTALCDVYQPHLAMAAEMAPDATTFTDLRHVLELTDLDAVVVGTPDHWHAWPTIMACEAGKDVYVEKPISLTIGEGRAMVNAVERTNRVVQVGTQQRTAPLYQQVRDLVQGGTLGDVRFVRTWNYDNATSRTGMGTPPDGPPPDDLDWDLWLGPAPKVPYNPNRFGSFRQFWDYAGGRMTDWGVHHIDIVHWAMGVDAPVSASTSGGNFFFKDNRETPDTLIATLNYPGFLCTYESRYNNVGPDGKRYGISFHGSNGTLFVDRSGFTITPEEGPDDTLRMEPMEGTGNGNAHAAHMRNFLDCVKSREQPICDIETGHRSSSAAMLGNIAYRTGRQIHWDAEREHILDDDEANALLRPNYQKPWTL